MAERRVASHHPLFSRAILAALTLIALLAGVTAQPLWAQPVVTTDQREYPLGATVHILGSGFAGNETVTVKVHRTSALYESGPAFEPFVVEADATGHFSAPWQLVDGIGVNFRVSAVGAMSGAAVEPADFHRGARVTTDRRRYAPGDTAHISGSGFRPGAPVTVTMEHAQPIAPGPATADADGRFNATFVVDTNPSAPSHRVEALGAVDAHSWISAMTGFAEGGTTLVDDGGPEDVPRGSYWSHWRENDLTYYRFSFRRDITPRVLDITVGWNASWIGNSYNLPTVYLDTNHNGRVDLCWHGRGRGRSD